MLAGRYSTEIELSLVGENCSDRAVRAYQGALEVQGLLRNRVILLSVQSKTPLGSHSAQRFSQYCEINEFEDSNPVPPLSSSIIWFLSGNLRRSSSLAVTTIELDQ